MGQQTKSTKSKPRKRRNDGGNRVVFIIAAVLMVIYLGGRLSNAFSAAPETTPALHVTVNDSFTSDGWFFRDEEPIDNATGSSVKHIVYSGERVQQDAPLAIIYSDQESMDLSRQLDPLEERISLLDTALQSASDSSNIAKLDQVITLTIEQLAEQVKEGSGSSVASAASSLRTLSLRREAGNVDTNEVSAERDALVSEQSSLEHQLTGRTTELTASSSGYFSEVVDGYESILTPSSLDEMTVEQFDKTVAQQPSAENSNSLGKIVKGFNWYLAAKIPAEQAERLQVPLPGKIPDVHGVKQRAVEVKNRATELHARTTCSESARSARHSSSISGAAKMALTSATPLTPVPASCGRFSLVMPPMATTGMLTLWQISRSVSWGSGRTFVLVEVTNTAPEPR